MTRYRPFRCLWIGVMLAGLLCACGLFSSGSGSSPSSSNNPISAPPQAFPLTPNPVNVQITLDTKHAISSKYGLSANLADGGDFNFIPPDNLLTQAADGSYAPANGTTLTLTPVSAIGGIPFSKGYLAAFQLGPEGLLMVMPGTFELKLAGNYSDLVGFASNGDGTDFHLYPIQASTSGGFTWVTFDVMHFSMYGVAEATQSEIVAQQSHPPADPGNQDDDLLAAPQSKAQLALSQEYNRLLKSALANLNACNNVIQASRNFVKWYGNVQAAGQQNYFKDTINTTANTLLSRLKDCVQISCPLCMQGKKSDKAAAKTLIVQSTYIQTLDLLQGNAGEANYYRELANKCAANAGLPLPSPHVADCQGNNCGPTPTQLSCP